MGEGADAGLVSVVMPVRDAAATVAEAASAVLSQDHDGPLELVIALAPSSDGTAAIVDGLAGDDRVTVVANPGGGTSAGLNAAIAAARGSVIVRCDAHAILPPQYVRTAVRVLDETGADVVGGVQAAVGEGLVQRAIAIAQTTPMGVGDARYRTGGTAGAVDTVYLGVFRRMALDHAGGFDERQLRNQDYELNWRIRSAGGVVWFDPSLVVEYRPRTTLRELARQYFDYGRWKRVMLRRHPSALRWRQLAPPALVLGVIGSLVGLGTPWPWTAAVIPGVYLAALALTGVGLVIGRRDPAGLVAPAALAVMHTAWGLGFVVGGAAGGTAR